MADRPVTKSPGACLVVGGSGFLGRATVPRLRDPLVTSRGAAVGGAPQGGRRAQWDPVAGPLPAELIEGVDTVIHLAGEPVADRRWSAAVRRRIRESRVLGTRHVVEGIRAAGGGARVRCLVAASAVGFYGDRGDELLDESSTPGSGFLAEVCREWEGEAVRAEELGVRVVRARIGVILGAEGGALARLLPIFRRGLGGRLGGGRQWVPWIALDDAARLLVHASSDEGISGPLNVNAPAPVRNRELTRQLARWLGRPALLPVPGPALRLALGGFASALLASQRVHPAAALARGFRFEAPELPAALRLVAGDGGRGESGA